MYVNSTVTATWSGIPAPSTSDWLGLFNPGAPSTGFYLYGSTATNGAASGSVPFGLQENATPGTYELRLFSNGSYTLLATSNSFTVVPLPTVSGTLSVGGAALSDVTFTATNGVTCTMLNNAVDYNCSVPSGWSGSVTPSRGGVSFTPASRSYSNVTANQTAQNYTASSTTTLSVSPTSVFVNGAVTAAWSGTAGPSGSNWLGLYNPGAPSTGFYLYGSTGASGASGSVPFGLQENARPGTYELRLFGGGYALLATSNSFTVNPLPTVSGTLSLGGAALSDVTFTATNGVTCTMLNNAVDYNCSVPSGWSGSVTPSRGGVSFTPASRSYSNVTANQTAQNYTASSTTTLSASPTSAIAGGAVTATWSGTAGPSGANWLGLFNPGAPSTGFYLYGSAGASGASGSVPFGLGAGLQTGTYELRLFGGGYALLATSNSFTVNPLRTVSGTVTLGGSALFGVAFAGTNGVTCTTSDTSGQYSCSVPSGWSGSVTPSRSGFSFTPASRTYNNVTTNQTAQDFTAVNVGSAAVYYIHPDHLNTPRMIANSTGTTVWRWDQGEPFGNDVPNDNPSGAGAFDFPLRFPGQYFDRETNLAYNYFRDYDPAIGRYAQSDPIGLIGGLNTYSYIRGNPISLTDPRGESWQAVVVVVVVGTWAINWTYWNVINPEPLPSTPPAPPLPPTGDNGFQCGPNFGAPPPPDLAIPGPWPDPRLSRPIQSPVGPPPQRPVPGLR